MNRFRTYLLLAAFVAAPGAQAANFLAQVKSDLRDYTPGDGVCSWVSSGPPPGEPMKYCSLRAAIMEANTTPEKDTIYLIPGETYTLSQPGRDKGAEAGDLNITAPLRIEALSLSPGPATRATIDANGIDRVFYISSDDVELVNLGITGGNNDYIPAVYMSFPGELGTTFEHVDIYGNIDPESYYFSAVASNNAVVMTDSVVHDNTGAGVIGNKVMLERSSVYANSGGVAATALVLVNSTISGNDGWGVAPNTINSAFTILNSTIANNKYGIYTVGSNISLTMINSIISGPGPSCWFMGDSLVTLVYVNNNIYSGSCPKGGEQDTSLTFTPALLSPLGNYGGSTPTHRLHTHSPAVDSANNAYCSLFDIDQRGQPRPADFTGQNPPRCDIGAFELESDVIFWDDFEQPL